MEHSCFPATRLRRMRSDSFCRDICRENSLTVKDLIYPIFIIEGSGRRESIDAMPGISRLSLDLLVEEARELEYLGLPAIALFPKIDSKQKTDDASEAFNPDGLVQRAIALIKQQCPKLGVITDIALDPYTLNGQDGLTNAAGEIINDATIEVLVQQALSHAKAGVDIVAPSDMMDGRIQAIRNCLEQHKFINTKILAYSAKYASCFYNPFRHAVASINNLGIADKNTYQMDPGNRREAIREIALDIQEGADMVMIKPALGYLDVIRDASNMFNIPILGYQVSGEYSMLMAGAQNGWLNEKAAILETLLCIKRAGASCIVSYFSKKVATWLSSCA